MVDSFAARYAELETEFRHLSDEDGTVYVPNPKPSGPVDFLFVAMEPSLGRWARTREEAEHFVRRGFRNFLLSIYDFIMHYSIQTFLCKRGETYHITDISKGAMLVREAHLNRQRRWNRWHPSLLEEINLVTKDETTIIALGAAVHHQHVLEYCLDRARTAELRRRSGGAYPLPALSH